MNKKETFGGNIKRGYQKHKCPLISRTCLHDQHPCLKPYSKKKRQKKHAKRHTKDLDIIRGQQNSIGGTNPKGKTNRA
jgi:hypothetical protein